jgi:RNA polymerase sigma-70 factor, ECF subfamily
LLRFAVPNIIIDWRDTRLMAHSNQSQQTRLVEQLFVRHVATIRGFIEAFVPDFHRADDVLQECFLTVAAKADSFGELKKGTGLICATTNAERRCPPPGHSGKLDLSPFSHREDADFLAWVMAIARFKVLESLRQPGAKMRSLSPEVIDALAAEAPADEPTGEPERLLQECVEELSPRAREVIDLRYGESCKPAEIARRLNWTPESVYVALSRARALLRDCIERRSNRATKRGAS